MKKMLGWVLIVLIVVGCQQPNNNDSSSGDGDGDGDTIVLIAKSDRFLNINQALNFSDLFTYHIDGTEGDYSNLAVTSSDENAISINATNQSLIVTSTASKGSVVSIQATSGDKTAKVFITIGPVVRFELKNATVTPIKVGGFRPYESILVYTVNGEERLFTNIDIDDKINFTIALGIPIGWGINANNVGTFSLTFTEGVTNAKVTANIEVIPVP